ncbi:hypothetical protein [Methylotenera mobilis]|jgi:hypothetical protein|uniref:hypothetical protein n=1 Tax=Methylotenera mobilis TaxID=359408 RepID=UPI000364F4B1|nr:hypothetical protein [Methylotenera mobilis]
MKEFPQFNKQQLELLMASIAFASFELSGSNNLAKTIVDFDYAFEHFAFNNPLNKRQLVNDPTQYSGDLLNPLIDALMLHYEHLSANDNMPILSTSVSATA